MADTGWQDCAADESNSGWTNPENMQGSDNSDALSFSTGDNVKQYNFSFTIPSGATIDGIEVQAESQAFASGPGLDLELYYNSRATAAPTTKSLTSDTSESWKAVGGATDLWGRGSWSDTDFTNANFAVKVTSTNISATFLFVDAIQAKVYYTVSSGWGHKINGIANANIGKVNGVSKANISKINGV